MKNNNLFQKAIAYLLPTTYYLLSTTYFLLPTTSNAQCFATVSSGNYFVTAKKTGGTIWSWGSGQNGALGSTTNANKLNPFQISTTTDWKSIICGKYNSFAIKNNGTLWATGTNTSNALGINSLSVVVFSYVQVGTDNDWSTVAAGTFSGFGIKNNLTLWGWGDNTNFELGDGTIDQHNIPTQIGTDTDWKAVAPSQVGSCLALKTNGTLWGWGTNGGYMLGDSSVSALLQPTQLFPDTDWDQIFPGSYHVLALKTNSTLWAWGNAGFGETGQDPNNLQAAPYPIAGSWKTAAAGYEFSMGIKTEGTLWAWGKNDVGQLGDGTTNNTYIPIQIGTATNWERVACGYQHTVALRSDGSLWSWGQNDYGQLGNGTTTAVAAPAYVSVAGCVLANEAFATAPAALTLAPNPAQNELNLRYNGTSTISTISIIDLTGRTVFTTEALNTNNFTASFSIANLQSGSYIVLLKNQETVVASERLVKQ